MQGFGEWLKTSESELENEIGEGVLPDEWVGEWYEWELAEVLRHLTEGVWNG